MKIHAQIKTEYTENYVAQDNIRLLRLHNHNREDPPHLSLSHSLIIHTQIAMYLVEGIPYTFNVNQHGGGETDIDRRLFRTINSKYRFIRFHKSQQVHDTQNIDVTRHISRYNAALT